MARRRDNTLPLASRRALLVAALAASVAALGACGQRESTVSGGAASTYELPDRWKTPADLSPVPVGSFALASEPASGTVPGGPFLLRLLGEPGAKILYAFREFAVGQDAATLRIYETPLLLLPPAEVWAVSEVDGRRGQVFRFAFEPSSDDSSGFALSELRAERLPTTRRSLIPWQTPLDVTAFGTKTASASSSRLIDGEASDWSMQGRESVADPTSDLPPTYAHADVSWLQASEAGEPRAIEVALGLARAPNAPPLPGTSVVYALDIGPSGIDASSYGDGADYQYRVEVRDGTLEIYNRATGEVLPSSASRVAVGSVVELSLALSDLPALADSQELAVRSSSIVRDAATGASVIDRVDPLFLRSQLTLSRATFSAGNGRPMQLDFLTAPSQASGDFVRTYLQLGRTLLPALERINKIPIQALGYATVPLFYMPREQNGFAGLNTSDRGLLTTVGAEASVVARAQLLAHELAHYQNARLSQLSPRWLQEGMSEWSAERLLYLLFPRRAAHKYMRQLRYDRYFDRFPNDELDDFSLDTWNGSASTLGYEKSLMLMAALEQKLGSEPLVAAFRHAVNEPMDSASFRSFLESYTGLDLTESFAFWLDPGAPASGLGPYDLFKDADGDGLLGIDERKLDTRDDDVDSDGDGYLDAEEYFRDLDPKISVTDPSGARAGADPLYRELSARSPKDTAALFRLAGAATAELRYTLDPYETASDGDAYTPYTSPLLLRPPFSVMAVARAESAEAAPILLERLLYVAGAPVHPPILTSGILPQSPRASTSVGAASTLGADLGSSEALPLLDSAGDLPEDFAPYNVLRWWVEDGARFEVVIDTAGRHSSYWEYGELSLAFEQLDWSGTSPVATRPSALTLRDGVAHWHSVTGDVESSVAIGSGVSTSFDDGRLTIALDRALIEPWLDAGGEPALCLNMFGVLETGLRLKDRAGCKTIQTSGFTRRAAERADYFGIGKHQVELFLNDAAFDAGAASHYVELGLEALRAFERVLGRPILERQHWPFHLTLSTSTNGGGATSRSGAFLVIPSSHAASTIDYLFVEQLARLHMADLLDRYGDRPYWLQEVYIQWLTSTALYGFYETAGVHAFHELRLNELVCVYQGACAANYPGGDLPIDQWTSTTLGTTASLRALTFALQLDAVLGPERLQRIFTLFTNLPPTAAGLRRQLLAEAGADSAAVEELWERYVTGSGDLSADQAAIRAALTDGDGDGLYVFEEERFGWSDAVVQTYLD